MPRNRIHGIGHRRNTVFAKGKPVKKGGVLAAVLDTVEVFRICSQNLGGACPKRGCGFLQRQIALVCRCHSKVTRCRFGALAKVTDKGYDVHMLRLCAHVVHSHYSFIALQVLRQWVLRWPCRGPPAWSNWSLSCAGHLRRDRAAATLACGWPNIWDQECRF